MNCLSPLHFFEVAAFKTTHSVSFICYRVSAKHTKHGIFLLRSNFRYTPSSCLFPFEGSRRTPTAKRTVPPSLYNMISNQSKPPCCTSRTRSIILVKKKKNRDRPNKCTGDKSWNGTEQKSSDASTILAISVTFFSTTLHYHRDGRARPLRGEAKDTSSTRAVVT